MDAIFRWLYMLHDGWLFAAVTALLLVVTWQVISEEQRQQPPEGKRAYFPRMVLYYGEAYVWNHQMPEKTFPRYLTYYGGVVTIMGALEWFVEGAPGLVVKLELWGLVGGILGYWFFAFLGALVGALLAGVFVNFHRGERVSVASTIVTSSSIGFLLGAFVGLLAGMSLFSYNFSLLYKLDLWVSVIIVAVPSLIVCVELAYKFNKYRKVGEFIHKCYAQNQGVKITVSTPYSFVEETEALPEIVIPLDPKARKFDEK